MRLIYVAVAVLSFFAAPVGAVSIPNNFQAGQTASAAEVNANFQALVQAVNSLQAQVDSQSATIASLQQDLAAAEAEVIALKSNTVLALDGFLFLDVDARGNDVARFDQVNVQITNGLGATNGDPGAAAVASEGPVNGLGNLIVGYNEDNDLNARSVCSEGDYGNQVDCEANGEIWAANQKTGSHNVIVGYGHTYTTHGALIAGASNAVTNPWASVAGGFNNVARGNSSSVSAGWLNEASGLLSAVAAGRSNEASGQAAGVSGGADNLASGSSSSVSGGRQNIAASFAASVGGGDENIASGQFSSVGGGDSNIASGQASSVSGGFSGIAGGTFDWRAGTLFEDD